MGTSSLSSSQSHLHFQRMGVENVSFLLDRLHADCSPLQFIRELTENSLAAVQARPDGKGKVHWDIDWNTSKLEGWNKLTVIDNGIGMTGEEMVGYINQLSSSIHTQSKTGNYGVGAKIAAAPVNPQGLVYLSWKDGVGYVIRLYRDDELGYGLQQFDHPDGTSEFWGYIDKAVKPDVIDKNGTMVVLFGANEEQDTMRPPENTLMPSRWILRYLNSRYFQFPEGVTVSAREGWDLPQGDKHNFLRRVTGMRVWLEENSETSGQVPLNNATARWWILKKDADTDSGHTIPRGHTAALYQNEMYEVAEGRRGTMRLQSFGVIFGYIRVVIYIEPTPGDDLLPSTARTHLILNGEELPWENWAAEFSEKHPQEIKQLVEEAGANAASTDHSKSIRDRLKQIRDLLNISRYRQTPVGKHSVDDTKVPGGETKVLKERVGVGDRRKGGRGGRAGNLYSLFLTTGGKPAKEVSADNFPQCKWICAKDETRIPPDLEDRAARYLPEKNIILINRDFRVFEDAVKRWQKDWKDRSGAEAVIEAEVRQWFEQQLVEAVLSAQALRRSTVWTSDDLKTLWNEESLTAVVLPRYHVYTSISRSLGAKLGKHKGRVA